MRTIPATLLTNLQLDNAENVFLIEVETTTPVYVTDAMVDVPYASNVYKSGELVSFSTPTESIKASQSAINVVISGVVTSNITDLTNNFYNKNVNVRLASVVDGVVTDTMIVYAGTIKDISTTQDMTSGINSVTLSVTNPIFDFDEKRGHLLSDEYQKRTYSGDESFEFLTNIDIADGTNTSGVTFKSEQTQLNKTKRLPIIYGIGRTDAIVTYQQDHEVTEGNPTAFGLYPTARRAFMLAYAAYEIESFQQMFIANVSQQLRLYDSKEDYTGTLAGATSPFLIGLAGSDWTSNHLNKNIAAKSFDFKSNLLFIDKLTVDDLSFEIQAKGRKILNLNTSVVEYSDNPAYVMYDFLTADYGFRLDSALLDTTSFINAANYYDTLTPSGDKFMTFNGVVDMNNKLGDTLKRMLEEFVASFVWANGKFTLIVDKSSSVAFAFNDSNILGKITTKEGVQKQRINTVDASYLDLAIDQQVTQQSKQNTTFKTADGIEQLKEINYIYTTNSLEMDRKIDFIINKSRTLISVNFETTIEYYEAFVGDVVTITNTDRGWINKQFRIERTQLTNSLNVKITAREHDSANYVLSVQTPITVPNTSSILSQINVSAPTSLTAQFDESFNLKSETSLVTRAFLSWTAPTNEGIIGFQVQKQAPSQTYWEDMYFTESAFYFSKVEPGLRYDFRVRSQTGSGYFSEYTEITADVPQYAVVIDIPNVTGLSVDNAVLSGNIYEWFGRDIKLTWRDVSSVVTELTDESVGDQDVHDYFFKNYKISFFSNGVEIFTDTTTDPFYNYNYDQQTEIGLNRELTVKVWLETTANQLSEQPAEVSISNPAPLAPTNIEVLGGYRRVTVSFTEPTDTDYSHTNIYLSSDENFTVSDSTLIDQVRNELVIDNDATGTRLVNQTKYYIKLVSFDIFDVTSTSPEASLSVTTRKGATDKLDGVSEWATRIDQADRDFIDGVLASDAIESTKIANLVAGKITTGTLLATTLIETEGYIRATDSGGALVELGLAGDANYLLRANDGISNTFYIDVNGDAFFAGSLVAGATLDASLTAGASGELILNGANANIQIGSTAYDVGNGIWIGKDSSISKLSIRNSSKNVVDFDGTTLTISGRLITTSTGQRIDINPSNDNEIHFWGDRGAGAIAELATIGISTSGSDTVVINVGSLLDENVGVKSLTKDTYALYGESVSGNGLFAKSGTGTAVRSISSSGFAIETSSDTGYGIITTVGGGGKAAICISPAISASAPTHTALKGSLWVTGSGVLYINTNGGTTWQKVGAQ